MPLPTDKPDNKKNICINTHTHTYIYIYPSNSSALAATGSGLASGPGSATAVSSSSTCIAMSAASAACPFCAWFSIAGNDAEAAALLFAETSKYRAGYLLHELDCMNNGVIYCNLKHMRRLGSCCWRASRAETTAMHSGMPEFKTALVPLKLVLALMQGLLHSSLIGIQNSVALLVVECTAMITHAEHYNPSNSIFCRPRSVRNISTQRGNGGHFETNLPNFAFMETSQCWALNCGRQNSAMNSLVWIAFVLRSRTSKSWLSAALAYSG